MGICQEGITGNTATTQCDKVQVVNKPLYLEVKPQVSTHNMSVKSPHCTSEDFVHTTARTKLQVPS